MLTTIIIIFTTIATMFRRVSVACCLLQFGRGRQQSVLES